MKNLKDLMNKKQDDGGDLKKNAKMEVLSHLKKIASDMMGEDLRTGLETTKRGNLYAGLKKADDVMEPLPYEKKQKKQDWESANGKVVTDAKHDKDILSDYKPGTEEDYTPDELEQRLAELHALKAKKTK